jgi:hypothetical protein
VLKGTVRLADWVLKHIFAIHPHCIMGRKTGNFFGCRVDVSDAPVKVGSEKAVRNPIENFHKAFFLLIDMLQRFDIVPMDLFRKKIIPALGVQFALFLKIAAGDARGYFLKKIVFNIIDAMGFGN